MPAVPLYKSKSLANAHTFAAVSPTIALARVQVDRGIHRANPDWVRLRITRQLSSKVQLLACYRLLLHLKTPWADHVEEVRVLFAAVPTPCASRAEPSLSGLRPYVPSPQHRSIHFMHQQCKATRTNDLDKPRWRFCWPLPATWPTAPPRRTHPIHRRKPGPASRPASAWLRRRRPVER